MNLRSITTGLVVLVTLLLLVACGETDVASPTNAPTAVVVPTATTGIVAEKPDTPIVDGATATQSPAVIDHPEEIPTPGPQLVDDEDQVSSAVFYEQDGITLEYYWPLDERGNLSADETEILAYNSTDGPIEFKSPAITFFEAGAMIAQASGTWEKFPTHASWDRNEYLQIPPSSLGGEPLSAGPGEKVKLHWHIDGVASAETDQSVSLNLTMVIRGREIKITPTLSRGGEGTALIRPATAIPVPNQPSAGHYSTAGFGSTGATNSEVQWSFNGSAWTPNGTAPSCSEPLGLQTPVDMSIVTGALWPGQQRGAYVAHGGFRFDNNADNNVTVRAHLGSHLVQASQYLAGGTPQYLLFFSVPCGFFYRFDHVLEVPQEMAEALKDVPLGGEGDSRTAFINPAFWVDKGDIVGTAVGISPTNIFVDFGLYDVRQPNNVTPDPAWADLFAGDKEFGHYGVCIFDYLSGTDGDTMRSLPTGKEGATSDFCD